MRRRRIPTTLDVVAQGTLVAALVLLIVAVLVGSGPLSRLAVLAIMVALTGLLVAYLGRALKTLRGVWTGENAVIQRIYDHVDDHVGAGRFERRKWARVQRRLDVWTLQWKRLLRPPAFRPGDVQMTGKRRYVQVGFRGVRKPFQRWKTWQVETVSICWTSEVNIYIGQFFHLLEQKVAMALGVEWTDGVFDRQIDHSTSMVVLARTHAEPVPQTIAAGDDLEDDLRA